MNDVWNLDPIYRGFDDPAFGQDFNRLESTLALLKAFSKTLDRSEEHTSELQSR